MNLALTLSRGLSRLRAMSHEAVRLDRHLDDLKMLQGKLLTQASRERHDADLRAYEFKVFSQWGEDGIIQRLIDLVPIKNRTFIEFGASDFLESNCRFLMMNDNWSGFVVDGSDRNIAAIRRSSYFWKYDLVARASFIDREHIDSLLLESGFDSDLGILSVDIDGVDYHVLEAIKSYRPRILITEYNSVFGGERKITVPYDASFHRTARHFSNLYFGASLGALDSLATKMGYSLVATTSEGVNAFFVRDDVLPAEVLKLDFRDAYVVSKLSESRGSDGSPTYLRGDARLAAIRGMPVINVETGQAEDL
jgi:hypothetical protein